MRVAATLRAAAAGLALTAIVDPACTRQVEAPVPVLVRSTSPDSGNVALAGRVRDHLVSRLDGRIDVTSSDAPRAVVLIGDHSIDTAALPDGIPVSVVTDSDPSARNVRIGSTATHLLLAGWPGSIAATVVATRAEGESSVITLEHDGVELGRVEHRWSADAETFEARFEYLPPAAGVRRIRISARPLDGETTHADNHADVRLEVVERSLKVLVYEPRPSWAASFIRRALEQERRLEVSSFVRASRGIEVRAGAAPERLRTESLDQFDVVIVGAPEELTAGEIDVLLRFARVRGGTIVFAPDRRPSGAYVRIVPVKSFDERLLDDPVPVAGVVASLRASELAVAVGPAGGIEVLAGIDRAGSVEPVVFGWPIGSGRAIVSGALDAWRHRGRAGEFPAFWRAHLAAAALAVPRVVETTLEPGIAVPGQAVRLMARVRLTETGSQGGAVAFPNVAARLIHPGGSVTPIRLWPAAEAGLFEAEFAAPGEGRYSVQVSAGRSSSDGALVVSADARTPRDGIPRTLERIAEATGGVAVPPAGLDALVGHLASLDRPTVTRLTHPARSPWWMSGFVLLLCAEWALRRRRGLS